MQDLNLISKERVSKVRNNLRLALSSEKNLKTPLALAVQKQIDELTVMCDHDLKEVKLEKCPKWLTKAAREEIKTLWFITEKDERKRERYTHRVEAVKKMIKLAEVAGVRVGLKDATILREKFCA